MLRRTRIVAVLALVLAALPALPARAAVASPAVAPPAVAPPAAASPAAASPAAAIETATTARPVAPGVTLTSVDTVDAGGWLRADVLATQLGGGVGVDYLSPGAVAADEVLRGPAGRSHAVAAINGDFFDINNSGAALGAGIQHGDLVQSPTSGHANAVGFTAGGLGRILQVYFEAARPGTAARCRSLSSTTSSRPAGWGCSRRCGAPTRGSGRWTARPASPRWCSPAAW